MNTQNNHTVYILFLSLLVIILSGCNEESDQVDTLVYTPACEEQELIDAINDANDDGAPSEIQLPALCDYTLTEVENSFPWNNMIINNGLPAITSEITIQGNYSTIWIQITPGDDPFGHFYLDVDSELKLYDLYLRGGVRDVGGSVIINQGKLLANHVSFTYNRALQPTSDSVAYGGAIYSYFGKVTLQGYSHFGDNYAGVPVPSGPNLGGAIYAINSALTINDTGFNDNYVAGHGGAIYSEKTATHSGPGALIMQNTSFYENEAVQDGGAIYLKDETHGVFIASGSFNENLAGGNGGAIFSQDSDVSTNFPQFHYNQAENGGAVYSRRSAEGEFSIFVADNSVYAYNTAEDSAGAFFSENSDIDSFNSIFVHNEADRCGGLQLGGYPNLDIAAGDLQSALRINSHSEFETGSAASNRAFYGDGGGGCHLMGELVLDDFGFNDNQASGYGGGLLSMDILEVTDSSFTGNQANRGGGLAVGFPVDDNNPLSPAFLNFLSRLTSVWVSENDAGDQGGGIWAHNGGFLQIIKSTIGGNTAVQEGGGVYLDEGYIYLANSTLAENTASRGGGLYNVGDNSDLHLIHTTIASNIATDGGGGSRPGGGGINTKDLSLVMRQVLVVLNSNEDCSYGPIKVTGGSGGIFAFDESGVPPTNGVDSDGTCIKLDTEVIPEVGTFNGTYVPIQGSSPLIDRIDGYCYRSTDQIGTSRKQGSSCEPGSIEYQSITLPPPPPQPEEEEEPHPQPCDPFAGLDIAVNLLNINPETLTLPVYLRFSEDLENLEEENMPYQASLGDLESFMCNQQGFPDRLYCFFTLLPDYPGTLRDLNFYKENCEGPVFTQPGLSIPDIPSGDLTCRKDLGEKNCTEAGGIWPSIDKPYCICP